MPSSGVGAFVEVPVGGVRRGGVDFGSLRWRSRGNGGGSSPRPIHRRGADPGARRGRQLHARGPDARSRGSRPTPRCGTAGSIRPPSSPDAAGWAGEPWRAPRGTRRLPGASTAGPLSGSGWPGSGISPRPGRPEPISGTRRVPRCCLRPPSRRRKGAPDRSAVRTLRSTDAWSVIQCRAALLRHPSKGRWAPRVPRSNSVASASTNVTSGGVLDPGPREHRGVGVHAHHLGTPGGHGRGMPSGSAAEVDELARARVEIIDEVVPVAGHEAEAIVIGVGIPGVGVHGRILADGRASGRGVDAVDHGERPGPAQATGVDVAQAPGRRDLDEGRGMGRTCPTSPEVVDDRPTSRAEDAVDLGEPCCRVGPVVHREGAGHEVHRAVRERAGQRHRRRTRPPARRCPRGPSGPPPGTPCARPTRSTVVIRPSGNASARATARPPGPAPMSTMCRAGLPTSVADRSVAIARYSPVRSRPKVAS